jgi:hypothetical protein
VFCLYGSNFKQNKLTRLNFSKREMLKQAYVA